MPSLKQSFEQIPPEVYLKTQTDVLQLKSRLPADTVGTIVNEVLSRVKGIASRDSYPIDSPPQHVVDKLCYALISSEADEGTQFVENLRDDGASLEAIYLAYLAEAARTLGEWWQEDHVSFVEVSIASSRIYSIMRSMSYLFVSNKPVTKKSAIFASVPEETHIVGVRMAADLLGQKGWDIELLVGLSHAALLDRISASDCRIIGLSASGLHSASTLARLVVGLRLCNPEARMFVSGQIVHEAPDLVALMGVDAIATTVDEALGVMGEFWTETSLQNA